MISTSIISNKPIANDVYILKIPRPFSFIPGQVIGLTLDKSLPPRLYSIASGAAQPFLDILYDVKRDGILTPKLSSLKKDDRVWITPPAGIFWPQAKEKAWWLASGTGIAPFASVLFSETAKNIKLIHGGRKAENFYFSSKIESMEGVDYLKCCTRESLPGHYHGRLTHWLKEQVSLPLENKYYLCGSAEMVVETRDILVEKGISFGNIIAEIYF